MDYLITFGAGLGLGLGAGGWLTWTYARKLIDGVKAAADATSRAASQIR